MWKLQGHDFSVPATSGTAQFARPATCGGDFPSRRIASFVPASFDHRLKILSLFVIRVDLKSLVQRCFGFGKARFACQDSAEIHESVCECWSTLNRFTKQLLGLRIHT